MYNATKWLDKVVDVDSGEVIQAGTDQSAAHFNNMESGRLLRACMRRPAPE